MREIITGWTTSLRRRACYRRASGIELECCNSVRLSDFMATSIAIVASILGSMAVKAAYLDAFIEAIEAPETLDQLAALKAPCLALVPR